MHYDGGVEGMAEAVLAAHDVAACISFHLVFGSLDISSQMSSAASGHSVHGTEQGKNS
jgi:hypothetical protein